MPSTPSEFAQSLFLRHSDEDFFIILPADDSSPPPPLFEFATVRISENNEQTGIKRKLDEVVVEEEAEKCGRME